MDCEFLLVHLASILFLYELKIKPILPIYYLLLNLRSLRLIAHSVYNFALFAAIKDMALYLYPSTFEILPIWQDFT